MRTGPRSGHLLALLAVPAFRRLAGASLVSVLGDGVFRVAIGLQVLAVTGEPWALGLVGLVWVAAQFALLPLGGAVSDRFPRRTVVLLADLWRAAAIGAIGALSAAGVLALWHLLVLGFCFGAGNAFFNPAFMSLLPDVVDERDLDRANTLISGAKPAALYIVGPAIGAAVIGGAGLGPAFLFDALTFVLAAVLVARIPPVPLASSGGEKVGQGVAEAIRFVRGRRWLSAGLLATAVSALMYAGPFEVLVPYLLVDDLSLGDGEAAGVLARIFAASGVGALVTMAVLGRVGAVRRPHPVFYVGEAAGLLGLVVLATMSGAAQGMVGGFITGAMFALTEVLWTTTVQRSVPRAMLGRVASIEWMVGIGLVPVSLGVAGTLGGLIGARPLLLGAGLLGAAVVLALGVPARHRLPAQSTPVTPDGEPDPQPAPSPGDRADVGRATA